MTLSIIHLNKRTKQIKFRLICSNCGAVTKPMKFGKIKPILQKNLSTNQKIKSCECQKNKIILQSTCDICQLDPDTNLESQIEFGNEFLGMIEKYGKNHVSNEIDSIVKNNESGGKDDALL